MTVEGFPQYTGIFDSHAHYDDKRFDADRETLAAALPEKGVCAVVNVGCDLPSSRTSAEYAERYPHFYAAAGYHPHAAKEFTKEGLDEIAALLQRPRVIALGEIGLDYHYGLETAALQQRMFERQLQLAKELDLPVIIHSREATEDTLAILKRYPGIRGVIHCFSGSAETAKVLLGIGWYIGFTGVLTFENARKTLEACRAVPPERLLLETDCPYMAPAPFRGKRCWSPMIARTAEKAAELHSLPVQVMIDKARENTMALFGIKAIS